MTKPIQIVEVSQPDEVIEDLGLNPYKLQKAVDDLTNAISRLRAMNIQIFHSSYGLILLLQPPDSDESYLIADYHDQMLHSENPRQGLP